LFNRLNADLRIPVSVQLEPEHQVIPVDTPDVAVPEGFSPSNQSAVDHNFRPTISPMFHHKSGIDHRRLRTAFQNECKLSVHPFFYSRYHITPLRQVILDRCTPLFDGQPGRKQPRASKRNKSLAIFCCGSIHPNPPVGLPFPLCGDGPPQASEKCEARSAA
jgi:hypothetical protein